MLSPKSLNYRMPAEWHLHSATQLHWPSNKETWPGERLKRVEQVYLQIIDILHRYEPIHLFVEKSVLNRAKKLLNDRSVNFSKITIHPYPVNDVWARDCGPIFICKKQDRHSNFAITDWEYNAWGEKYRPFEDDNKLPQHIADLFQLPRFSTDMVLEGGSVDTNGDGILLTTESVLLNPNRNPNLSKQEIEQKLKTFLGIEKVIWLKGGLVGDDTDGHIDDVARFLNRTTILAMVAENKDDVNYEILRENLESLLRAADQYGNKFTIEPLPMPQTKIEDTTVDGSQHVPASYANFYVANGVVLVPLYDKRYDQKALNLLEQYYPGRDVIGVPCADLVWGQGSIHCITQQWYGIE